MSVNRKMSMGEFAEHETSGRGSQAEFLAWKDEGDDGDGQVRIVLVDDPFVLWRHELHRLVKVKGKDDKGEKEKLFRLLWNSMEDEGDPKRTEELLRKIKKQGYWLDRDDERVLPRVDPVLKLLEWLRDEVLAERIDELDPIFRYSPRDDDDLELRAATVLGVLPEDVSELEEADRERLKKLKIDVKKERRLNWRIGVKFLFVVVNYDKPERGCLLAVESETVGNEIKRIYRHRMTRFKNDAAKADMVRRLVIQLNFFPKKQFSDMYEVIALDDEEMTDLVKEQFAKYDAEPVDTARVAGLGNVAELEKNLREAWCHETVAPPWKELFAAAYQAVKGTGLDEAPTDFNHGANARESAPPAKVALPEPASMVPCEACAKPMPETAMECPHCKAQYAECFGFVSLATVKCEACGKDREFAEPVCGWSACKREYEVGEKDGEPAVVLKPLPPPPAATEPVEEVRASRRRQPAKS